MLKRAVIRLYSKRMLPAILLLAGLSVVNGCERFYGSPQGARATMTHRRQLDVATVRGPFSLYRIGSESQGLEADLLKDFADTTGLEIQWHLYDSNEEAIKAVTHGLADLTALHSSGILSSALVPGPTYQEAELSILCPKQLSRDGQSDLVVLDKDDSFAIRDELLAKNWKSIRSSKRSLHSLLKANLKSPQNSCYLAEDTEAKFELQFFPQLKWQSKLALTQPLRFWLNNKDPKLVQALFYWNQKISRDGTLSRIRERYSRSLQSLTAGDLQLFLDSMDDEFKTYESLFKKTAVEQRIPWQLLAAVSFQESHWNHEARSYTGVRGLMMLTEDTAEQMGVTDRRDPEQSVWGGAKYLRFLLKMQPAHLAFRERLSLALAAYNIGYGHLRDAQRLAVQLGKSPFAWKDLREVLPLLAEERWANSLEFGDARGQETVDFTERVLAYYELMAFHP